MIEYSTNRLCVCAFGRIGVDLLLLLFRHTMDFNLPMYLAKVAVIALQNHDFYTHFILKKVRLRININLPDLKFRK